MWKASGSTIEMVEGDYGIGLPIKINGITFGESDAVEFRVTKVGNAIIAKTFTGVTQNTVEIELTEAETALLPPGSYVYALDWYRDGAFMCNIIPDNIFRVVDKV